jgi:GMP synthase PP-ATPase subunit
MFAESTSPAPLPASRILGPVTAERRRMLALVDVVVGFVSARHRVALAGWKLEAALVESRPDFRGGETVAIRATPLDGRSPADLPPVPLGALREIASRSTDAMPGIANVVPDIAAPAPDVDGLYVVVDQDDWEDDARTA